ncbi:zinc finger AN1 domain-containing stress-associated protein 15-like [Zingiber officinale]|uniref:AN1-type domain-containing protein n=1 Tax=Zingiber officinale TaxID=94328 RepID=A0A8J5LSS2_ZINOF|nr:zinc finger AN1 domain-containing stress-associated protein 15-like [Zingiber officinale]KAG6522150.1 hypothetical protein ZIOFF_019287 [Zingiber officinale]
MAGERCDLNKDEAEILKPSSSSSSSSPSILPQLSPQGFEAPERPERFQAPTVPISCPPKTEEDCRPSPTIQSIKHCLICRKRVGLTGFWCRCGDLFCKLHRYSDSHDCSFDYKADGREQIATANPFIRAAKIIKI